MAQIISNKPHHLLSNIPLLCWDYSSIFLAYFAKETMHGPGIPSWLKKNYEPMAPFEYMLYRFIVRIADCHFTLRFWACKDSTMAEKTVGVVTEWEEREREVSGNKIFFFIMQSSITYNTIQVWIDRKLEKTNLTKSFLIIISCNKLSVNIGITVIIHSLKIIYVASSTLITQ